MVKSARFTVGPAMGIGAAAMVLAGIGVSVTSAAEAGASTTPVVCSTLTGVLTVGSNMGADKISGCSHGAATGGSGNLVWSHTGVGGTITWSTTKETEIVIAQEVGMAPGCRIKGKEYGATKYTGTVTGGNVAAIPSGSPVTFQLCQNTSTNRVRLVASTTFNI